MKVLVTGHLGYIGNCLVPLLIEAGHDVTGLDTGFFKQCAFGGELISIPTINKDIRDVCESDLKGFESIIHLAGLSNDPLGDLNSELTFEINHLATVRIAKLAKQCGVKRFLFSSSCSNYGASGDAILDEIADFNPVTPYGVSKVRAEMGLQQLADQNFSPTFLRSSTAYGLSNCIRFDLVVNNLMAWAYTTGQIYLKSDGSPWRPLVHIEDISRAFIAVLSAPRELIHNQAFNVGRSSENYQIQDLAQLVGKLIPNSKIEFSPDAGPDKRCYRVSCDKLINTIPGYQPQWHVEAGMKQLLEAFKRNTITVADFEGPRYKRIDHINLLIESGELDNNLRWQH